MKNYWDQTISRRSLLELGLAGVGTLMFPFPTFRAMANDLEDPHFFIQILLPGGVDSSYLFDARPLAFTQKNLIQNYTNVEPTQWMGGNDAATWASAATDSLRAHKDTITVLNGVLMSDSDGHDQNMNFLLAGNTFGGDSFLPQLNSVGGVMPLDCVQSGNMHASLTNLAATVPLTKDAGAKLIGNLKNGTEMNLEDPTMKFVTGRLGALGIDGAHNGTGRFSMGSKNMLDALKKSPGLAELLKKVTVPNASDENAGFFQLVGEFFKYGISKTAVLSLSDEFGNFDTHAPAQAQKQPEQFKKLAGIIGNLFDYLKTNQYDEKRNFLEVTTVLISSEFSRTMRQGGRPIDGTGTDHNQLSNSMIIAGKGIKGGQVIGSSDYQTPDAELSLAHKHFDKNMVKLMGRPFNFTTMKSRKDLPDTFAVKDYLTANNVVNTIYSLFNVSPKLYRLTEKNGNPALVLAGLLS